MYRRIPKSKLERERERESAIHYRYGSNSSVNSIGADSSSQSSNDGISYHDRELAAIIQISKVHTLTYVLYTVCTSRHLVQMWIYTQTQNTLSFYLIRRTIVARFLFRFLHFFFASSSSLSSTTTTFLSSISPYILHSSLFLFLISFGNPFRPHFNSSLISTFVLTLHLLTAPSSIFFYFLLFTTLTLSLSLCVCPVFVLFLIFHFENNPSE